MDDTYLECHVPFKILYKNSVDVNGFDFPRHILKLCNGQYQTACYLFCGNGAVGFHLLHQNKVDSVHFMDQYQPALDGCKKTAELHNWTASYSTSWVNQNYDLIIADPPWWNKIFSGPDLTEYQRRCFFDLDFVTHKEMFAWIASHLNQHGDSYVIRDCSKINKSLWNSMIPKSLTVCNEHPIKFFANNSDGIKVISATVVHLKLSI